MISLSIFPPLLSFYVSFDVLSHLVWFPLILTDFSYFQWNHCSFPTNSVFPPSYISALFIFFFNWRMVDLQCFRYTSKWFSCVCMYIYIYFFLFILPNLSFNSTFVYCFVPPKPVAKGSPISLQHSSSTTAHHFLPLLVFPACLFFCHLILFKCTVQQC